jgi:NADH dehydrogenase [ubiquinone] 1 alpha subcomplex assembly factor 7
LTANVDFAYLREAVGDLANVHGPIAQRDFLESLGLQPRLMALLASATPERRKDIESGAKRLIDLTGMGQQYQVMGITSGGDKDEVYPFPARITSEEPVEEAQTPKETSS